MNHPGGENHAEKLFAKPEVPGGLGDSLERQVSRSSGKSLRRSPQYGEKLGEKVQRKWSGSICQKRGSKETGRKHQGTRTARRPEGARNRSAQKFFRQQDLSTEKKAKLVEKTW